MNARELHNAKARQSTAGVRKKGKKRSKTQAVSADVMDVDPNADILVPKTKEEKDLERKNHIRAELLSESQSKINSKKKKRLDKYIDKKLLKEERNLLFEKFKETQAQLPSTLQLQSSATLGTGRPETHQQRLERDEHHEVRRALDGLTGGSRKRKRRDAVYEGTLHSDSDEDVDMGHREIAESAKGPVPEGTRKDNPIVVIDPYLGPPSAPPLVMDISVGSALKRNADGSLITPKVVKRAKKSKSSFRGWRFERQEQAGDNDMGTVNADSSTSSFNSSDSSDDSGSEAASNPSEGENESKEEEEEETTEAHPVKRRGFKDWALRQIAKAKGYDLSLAETGATESDSAHLPFFPSSQSPNNVSRPRTNEMRGPLGADYAMPPTALAAQLQKQEPGRVAEWKKTHIISRPDSVQEARLLLPVVAEEQMIMETVLLNPAVIICGETGSGKTTQIPQFLYEAGFGVPGSDNPGMIGITQPRRVAAVAMANRVAYELSLTSSKVSYQIRYDTTISPSTSLKFMTDGVLLRELATDFLLTRYSVIIIDEAHERSINTDILIGVLSRVVNLREEMGKKDSTVKPLRLIIMSATLRVNDFAENKSLFSDPPPVINIAARQHPVTVHFNRRTPADYITEAIRKASKIHARLPPGGILIFLTGQNEIAGVCRKLEAKYGRKTIMKRRKVRSHSIQKPELEKEDEDEDEDEDGTTQRRSTVSSVVADIEPEDLDLGLDTGSSEALENLATDVDGDQDDDALDSDDDAENENTRLGIESEECDTPMHILPLYSLLPPEKQMLVFEPPPQDARLVVVATNVAETSLTIPGIRYVVDCGRAKERQYDPQNGIQSFQVGWVSKASAAQRAGRAGRTGPGHCYRLYSSALYEHYFDQFASPEILRAPIEGVVLQMKGMHLDTIVNFPFPTPPDRSALVNAEKTLLYLGALAQGSNTLEPLYVTDLGKIMSLFPLSPRFSRILAGARKHGCLPYAIVAVAALSVGEPFLHEEVLNGNQEKDDTDSTDSEEFGTHISNEAANLKEARRLKRRAFYQSQQVHRSLGSGQSDIFRLISVVGAYEYAGGGRQFCVEHYVRPKAMEEIHKLRTQITNIVQTCFHEGSANLKSDLTPPSDLQLKVLRQLFTAAFIDHVAVRKDLVKEGAFSGNQYATTKGVPYRALGVEEDVFIHPSSVLAAGPPPKWVVYQDIIRTTRPWMKTLTIVNPAWLSTLGKPTLCTFSKTVKGNDGQLVAIPHFGPDNWELPPVKVEA